MASDPFYDAVAALPAPHSGALPVPGWDIEYNRVDVTGTLITPNILVSTSLRHRTQQRGGVQLGFRTRNPRPQPERAPGTAAEVGFGVRPLEGSGPFLKRYAVACYEQRLSGIAPCCQHIVIDSDESADRQPRYYVVEDEARWDEPLPAFYSTNDPAFDSDAGVCPGLATESECRALRSCRWAQTWPRPGFTCLRRLHAATSTYNTYRDYVDDCSEPLAVDDGLFGAAEPLAFFVLSERVDESLITPIPLALDFDGAAGSLDADRAAVFGRVGDVVGFGDNTLGGEESYNGVRVVALSATALSPWPEPQTVRTHSGLDVLSPAQVLGDGTDNGGGADHVDYGAPLLLEIDGRQQVVATSMGNERRGDNVYYMPLSPATEPGLRAFLDPDGDGHHRGFIDVVNDAEHSRSDYIDGDGDGLSEYFLVPGDPTAEGCIASSTHPGMCLRATLNDNCGPPLAGRWLYDYANRDQRDRDGDGVGDVCDTCPGRWQDQRWERDEHGVEQPGYCGGVLEDGEDPEDPEDDEDPMSRVCCLATRDVPAAQSPTGRAIPRGNPVAPLCMRFQFRYTNSRGEERSFWTDIDRDNDGALDFYCDNCPPGRPGEPTGARPRLTANRDQADRDGDGIGDHCDVCPDTPNTEQDPTDADGDGVADVCDNCPPSRCLVAADCANPPEVEGGPQADADGDGVGDVCDNCDATPNTDQRNCNLELERTLDQEPVGDACDPVPCAETTISTSTSRRDGLGRATVRMNRIEYEANVGTEDPDAPPMTLDGRTTLRFCRCQFATGNSPEARRLCADPIVGRAGEITGEGDCDPLNIGAHDATPEQLPWRWTTQAPVSTLAAITNPTFEDLYDRPGDSFDPNRELRWRLEEQDVPRWLRNDITPNDPDTPLENGETFPVGRAIPGVLWTHTPGEVGQPDFDVLPEYGLLFRQLASYLWSGAITAPITTRPPTPCFVPFLPFLGGSEICPFCEAHIPQPWLVFPRGPRCSGPTGFPFLQLGGIGLDQTEQFELPGVELFASDPGPWIAAAETGRGLTSQDGLRYVKLEGGSNVTRLIAEVGGAFFDPASGCQNQQCDDTVPPPALATAALAMATPSAARGATAGDLAPLAREGQAAVLSADRLALWLVGGRAVPGGGELRDLWRYDISRGAWHSLPLDGVTLGHVLSATYSASEGRLFVLDEVYEPREPRRRTGRRRARRRHRGPRRSIRLLSLGADGGPVRIEATWRRRSPNASFAMSVDPSGALWVAGSPSRARAHVVVRLVRRSDGALGVDGWDVGRGGLHEAGVRASERGLSVVGDRGPRRAPRLRFHATADLYGGSGGESACF